MGIDIRSDYFTVTKEGKLPFVDTVGEQAFVVWREKLWSEDAAYCLAFIMSSVIVFYVGIFAVAVAAMVIGVGLMIYLLCFSIVSVSIELGPAVSYAIVIRGVVRRHVFKAEIEGVYQMDLPDVLAARRFRSQSVYVVRFSDHDQILAPVRSLESLSGHSGWERLLVRDSGGS